MKVPNLRKGEVRLDPVDVGGFEAGVILRLGFPELRALQAVIPDLVEEMGPAVLQSPEALCTIVTHALSKHQPELTEDDVAEMIQEYGSDRIAEKVVESFLLSFPEAAPAGTDDPPKPAAAGGISPVASTSGSSSGSTPKASTRRPRVSSRK